MFTSRDALDLERRHAAGGDAGLAAAVDAARRALAPHQVRLAARLDALGRAIAGLPPPPAAPHEREPAVTWISAGWVASIAATTGLAAHLPALLATAWPSVRLGPRRGDDPPPVGGSKLGGDPDLPTGLAWPYDGVEPLAFLAQLDLAAMAPHRDDTHLPATGHLLFFLHLDAAPEQAASVACRVVRVPAGAPLARREPPEELDAALRFPEAGLDFYEDLTGFDADLGREDPAAPAIARPPRAMLRDFLENLAYDRPADPPIHRVGGIGEVLGDAGRYGQPGNWRLLLQLDSDARFGGGMRWGADGRLYFWIRRADLLAGRFDRVECSLGSP